MTRKSDQDWAKDFQDFLQPEETRIPQELHSLVSTQISKWMNPNSWVVFSKLVGIHLVVGSLSLSFCHQFGMNPFQTEKSLADWFMRVGGHHVCMFACGILFVGISLLAAGYFLKIEEINALRKNDLTQSLSLGVLSLGLFAVFGAELAIGFASIWLVGGLIGGWLATETVWRLKQI
ncbi:MAG: hypothetical protein A2622_00430 [Bdellovibrionales bacterium RIFCSPHIGHO2_01_FULL_40_29]|nr:MAG: hypothetical protein A2622_00430 [Bdellovibrionales bacterium RIFCSPHIGHO2_01_FULL_40_29]OFZ32590.1 MAG: hypothetical protein A3D17_05030 [Bdellovibrionales bacterium RIFCSPHIGHO2_02_FULL_40_15]